MNSELLPGINFFKQKAYQKAYDYFMNLEIDPAENTELAYHIAISCSRLGYYDEALEYIALINKDDLNLAYLYQIQMVRGYIYILKEDFRRADYEVQKLLDNKFESPQVFSLIGFVRWRQGYTMEAVKFLKRGLEYDGNNPNLLNSLGYILADRGLMLDEAIDYCKRAVTIDPENPMYLDSLGWAYFKKGSFIEARVFLKRASSLAPNNKDVKAHLESALKV